MSLRLNFCRSVPPEFLRSFFFWYRIWWSHDEASNVKSSWTKSILISAAHRKAFRVSHSARHSSAQYGGGLVAGGASYRDLGSGTPRVIGQHCPCHDITTEHKTEKVSKFGNLQIQWWGWYMLHVSLLFWSSIIPLNPLFCTVATLYQFKIYVLPKLLREILSLWVHSCIIGSTFIQR